MGANARAAASKRVRDSSRARGRRSGGLVSRRMTGRAVTVQSAEAKADRDGLIARGTCAAATGPASTSLALTNPVSTSQALSGPPPRPASALARGLRVRGHGRTHGPMRVQPSSAATSGLRIAAPAKDNALADARSRAGNLAASGQASTNHASTSLVSTNNALTGPAPSGPVLTGPALSAPNVPSSPDFRSKRCSRAATLNPASVVGIAAVQAAAVKAAAVKAAAVQAGRGEIEAQVRADSGIAGAVKSRTGLERRDSIVSAARVAAAGSAKRDRRVIAAQKAGASRRGAAHCAGARHALAAVDARAAEIRGAGPAAARAGGPADAREDFSGQGSVADPAAARGAIAGEQESRAADPTLRPE